MSARIQLLIVALAILLVPFSIRAANRVVLGALPGPGYLPALENRRPRLSFDPQMIDSLRAVAPAWVFIGDSMLGTRIQADYLKELSTDGRGNILMVMAPATGPSWWYLAFKNWLVPSGVKPRATFIFFRDTNLTDTMFRLEDLYGHDLDLVAHDAEPVLDALVAARRRGVWARLYTAANRAYELDVARMWLEPAIRRWPTRWRYRSSNAQESFEIRMDQHFGLERLRKDVASDLDVQEDPDFHRDLPSSVLPDMMRIAREHQLPIVFVRVQRRPVGNRPPAQSPALQKYVSELKSWIESNGGMFHDDTGDPELTLDLYEDGDHFNDRRRYTEIFRKRLDPLFRPLTPPGTP